VDSGNIGKNDIHDPRNRRSTSPHSTFTKGSIEDFTLDDPELGSDLPLIFNQPHGPWGLFINILIMTFSIKHLYSTDILISTTHAYLLN
jgi:hypothetical protein